MNYLIQTFAALNPRQARHSRFNLHTPQLLVLYAEDESSAVLVLTYRLAWHSECVRMLRRDHRDIHVHIRQKLQVGVVHTSCHLPDGTTALQGNTGRDLRDRPLPYTTRYRIPGNVDSLA